ncbi:MAG: pilus assembly protein TadG-related protein [Terriglobia bacterium]
MPSRRKPGRCLNDSGSTLYLVAASMVFILATCGLAVDLVSLYTARSEAQRAADAAALAGATMFVSSGCTGGASGVSCTDVQSSAISQAEAVGNTNLVGGQSPGIADADISFPFDTTNGGNPRIAVNVQQTIPTFFMKIFGVTSETVSATATAEAYNPSLAGPLAQTICEGCLKPAIVPNCDPYPNHTSHPNPACPGEAYFINPLFNNEIANPGIFPAGVIGEEWTVSSQNLVTGVCGGSNPCYYELDFGGGVPQYPTNVSSCNSSLSGPTTSGSLATCGDRFNTLPVASVGSTAGAWETLIHQQADCQINGQDTIVVSSGTTPPYVITGGSANPNPALQGVRGISSSDSIVTVPLYNPPQTAGQPATIVGFMQLFIEEACYNTWTPNSDDVKSVILNITGCASNPGGCSSGNSGGGGTVSGGGASTIPVRLVQPG